MSYLKHAGRKDNCCEDCKPSPCDPCDVCSEAADLNIVFSGVTPCSCVDIGGGQWLTSTLTGFGGAYVVSWDGSQWYLGIGVGTFTLDIYSDAGCTTLVSHVEGALQITVNCLDGVYTVTVDAVATGDVFDGSGVIDTAINNTNVCSSEIASGGTATLSE